MSDLSDLPTQRAAGATSFDFLFGTWRVHHRKLRSRLTGCTEWDTFEGRTTAQPLLGGSGNVDDNVLDDPRGTYRAATIRRFDREKGQWSIWWLDDRFGTIDTPMVGSFIEGVGHFYADEEIDGRMVRVRFLWSEIARDSLRWEQAFSLDAGGSWEVNWVMHFERIA